MAMRTIEASVPNIKKLNDAIIALSAVVDADVKQQLALLPSYIASYIDAKVAGYTDSATLTSLNWTLGAYYAKLDEHIATGGEEPTETFDYDGFVAYKPIAPVGPVTTTDVAPVVPAATSPIAAASNIGVVFWIVGLSLAGGLLGYALIDYVDKKV